MKLEVKKLTLVPKSKESKKYQCQNPGCGKIYGSFGRYNCKVGGYCILQEVR